MNDLSLYEKVPSLEKNFPIKIRSSENVQSLIPHWHEHMELLYFISGTGDFNCNGNIYNVSAGDFIALNSNELHSITANKPMTYFYILIYPAFFSDVDFENTLLKTHIKNDDYIKNCVYDMYSEYTSDVRGSDMLLKSHSYRLIAYLMRNYTAARLSPKEYDAHAAKLKRLNEVLQYISAHYQEKITTQQLSKMCYVSESHFCRFFKSATGKNVTSYINELRVEKSAVLLQNTDESITSIAMNVGFDDVNYFDRIFKRIKNTSPGEYKRNLQAQKI